MAEVLKQRGALGVGTGAQQGASLRAAFQLSWEKVRSEEARRLFKLASYFPEATSIPLWLLGLAAGLGESSNIFEPLGEALLQLQELSLVEELSGEQVRLHPLVREFGRRLATEESDAGKALREEAGERLASEFVDLHTLEQRALQTGYWMCLEQVRAAYDYAVLLGTTKKEQLTRVERWLDHESYLLGSEQWWPHQLPGLFYQQLYNRSVEAGHQLSDRGAPPRWLRQENQVGAENPSLLRIFAGHTGGVRSVAYSPDGRQVLTGSDDQTARVWEAGSGRLLHMFEGHTGSVNSVAYSPDGRQVLTGSDDQTARVWETGGGKLLQVLQGHAGWVRSVSFSPDGSLVITCDQHGRVFFWRVREPEAGHLLGAYIATYEVGAVHWQDAEHVILVDTGGASHRIHFYLLKLEGEW